MRAASILIAIIAALASPASHALGFGRVVNTAQLGQPLNFTATLNLDADETLARECVAAEVLFGDHKLQPGQIRVTLESGPNARERSVRVTSAALVDEPVLTVSVTLGCAAKMTRRFVAFIDPPFVNLAPPTSVSDASAPGPQRVDSPLAPLVAIVAAAALPSAPAIAPEMTPERARRDAGASKKSNAGARGGDPAPRKSAARNVSGTRKSDTARTSTRAAPRAAPRTVARAAPRAVARSAAEPPRNSPRTAIRTPMRPAAVPVAAPGGPRLQLETTPTLVARAASAGTAAGVAELPPAAAAAAAVEQALLLDRERQRIVVLEEGLALLHRDSLATQQLVAGLQARLKQAETERHANPLVYGLAGLSGLLVLALVALGWRRSRRRDAAPWWSAPQPPAAADAAAREVSMQPQPPVAALTTAAATAATATATNETDTERTASIPAWVYRSPPVGAPGPAPPEAQRELSVEELIDLEQQAEFFVVLGQDDAAIDLLMSHVRSDGGISPLPYLKLLEIYRRRGETDAYERIRERFNLRFNAYAPDWDSDLQQGRLLESYPDIIARLNALWLTPARAMETLDASLFRRNRSDPTFELPAYRELLFLYSIARDLAEHGASEPQGDVDLLLPLTEPDAVAPPVSRLLASPCEPEDFANSHMVTLPLDLDVSLGAAPNPAGDSIETVPAALRRAPGQRFGAESGFLDFNLAEADDEAEAKADAQAVPGAARPRKSGRTGSSSGG